MSESNLQPSSSEPGIETAPKATAESLELRDSSGLPEEILEFSETPNDSGPVPSQEDPPTRVENDDSVAAEEENAENVNVEDERSHKIRLEENQPEISQLEVLEQRLEEQRKRVQLAERTVFLRRQRLLTNREKRDRIKDDLANLTAARDSLGSWLHERSQSLALRLLGFVDEQEALLKDEEKAMRAWAETPVPATSETAAQLRKNFVRNMLRALLAALLLPTLAFGLHTLLVEVGNEIPWLEGISWRYLIFGVVLFLVFVYISLASYHRGYIQMKVETDSRLAQGRYLLGAIEHNRIERSRIEGLTPQLRDRLQFLGAVLQEPWRVPGYGGSVEDTDLLNKGLPALLQIAKTTHLNDPIVIKLRAEFTASQFSIGMRRKAVDDLIRVAAEKRGIPSEQADLRVIDRDSATYGLRSALYDMVRDPEVLETVGRAQLTEIASNIQGGMTPSGERPGISRTNIETLHGLSVNHDLLAHWSTDQTSWDDYVVEILEDGAALSRLAFSPIGTAQSRHLKFQSIAVAPERLHERASHLIEFVKTDTGTITGAEIVVRIDITPAMDVNDVALFENHQEDQWQAGSESARTSQSVDTYETDTL
jgi:hypothetical protein